MYVEFFVLLFGPYYIVGLYVLSNSFKSPQNHTPNYTSCGAHGRHLVYEQIKTL